MKQDVPKHQTIHGKYIEINRLTGRNIKLCRVLIDIIVKYRLL